MKSAIQAKDIKNLAENGRGLQVAISATGLIRNMRRFPESRAAICQPDLPRYCGVREAGR